MKKENKVVKFVKEHKKAMAIAGASILGIGASVVAIVLYKNSGKTDNCINIMFDNADVDDVKEFGDMLNNIEDIADGSTISGVINIANKIEE